jgi:uncharacterized protein
MRLALESDPNINLIRSYGEGVITVGARSIAHACVVAPGALITDWTATSIAELTEAQLEIVFNTRATIVLLGAQGAPQLPSAALRALCRNRGIALETMNLGAACRTYNILAGEQRAVVAGLFP